LNSLAHETRPYDFSSCETFTWFCVSPIYAKIEADRKFWFIPPEYNYELGKLPKVDVLSNSGAGSEDEVIINAFDGLFSKIPRNSRICIDVTGMMRPQILFLLFFLKNRGFMSFDMIYTEPRHYRRKADTSFASEDISEVRQISGFEGSHTPISSGDVLIVGVGYDHHLISSAIESKAGAKVIQLHSLPSLSADMYQESLLRLERVSSSFTPALDGKHIYGSANDPFLVSSILSVTVNRLLKSGELSNLYLSPLATKPQTIGFGIFYLKAVIDLPMSIIFPFSSRYDRETSSGIGRTWRYPINF